MILDYAYSSYKFINYLHNNNINYIIRFKNNFKNYKDIIFNFKDIRFIKYQQIIEKEVLNKNFGNSSDNFKYRSLLKLRRQSPLFVDGVLTEIKIYGIKALY